MCSLYSGRMHPAGVPKVGGTAMTNTTQKLPATLGEQFAWLAQTPAAFYALLQVNVHHGQSQTAQLPHLWNTLSMQAFSEFLLQNPRDAFMLS